MEKKKKGGMKSAVRKIFAYLKGDKAIVTAALITAAIGAVLTLVGPNMIGSITDYMSEGLTGKINLGAIGRLALILAGVYVLSSLLTFLQHYIMAVVTLKCSKNMRKDLSEKINRVPISYFNKVPQGDVLSRITNDVSTLQQTLSNSLPSIISAAAQFAGCLVMMFVTEWRLALCVLGVTLVGMVILMGVMARSQRYFIARQESLGELNGYIEEMYSGHSVIRLSRALGKIKSKFALLNERVYDANWKSQFFSGVMQPLMTVIGNISYVAVCVVGAMLAMQGKLSIGVIVSFIMYARLFSTPLSQIAQGMTNMQTAAASAHRIFDFLESEELPDESEKLNAPESVRGKVEFEHVRFSYPDTPDKVIIKDFSATVEPGQKVAIVGPTGAGKTTLVNLLMRFFEINSGAIKIDGIAIDKMKREEVHGLFSMVLQETWLFEGTVRENLVYNMEGISDEEIERVCRICGMDKFIKSLPNGLDTVLSDTVSISAGQKQLMTIARAMLQNSPMLILDEATSSVDTRTELIIQRAMDELMKERTSFVIAHRLSTIKDADMIMVMKDGDIIERGTHEGLMEQGGFYAELYNSQFEQT